MNLDAALFVYHRALCNFSVDNMYFKCHKHNNSIFAADLKVAAFFFLSINICVCKWMQLHLVFFLMDEEVAYLCL